MYKVWRGRECERDGEREIEREAGGGGGGEEEREGREGERGIGGRERRREGVSMAYQTALLYQKGSE